MTQRDIAKRAGVSQATVSLVLNQARGAQVRIPEETRRRVEAIIAETSYVADPVARRMAKGRNRILGVFTYEAAFPIGQSDFFTPFLFGVEEAAEELGHDLLLMTGGDRDADGNKRLWGVDNRLRLADGCLLLGRRMNTIDLARLLTEDVPFVAIGRRDDAGGPVPYVGADYVTATRELVIRSIALGHHEFAYFGATDDVESQRDRWDGFRAGLEGGARLVLHIDAWGSEPVDVLSAIRASGATVVFFTELADAEILRRTASAAGLDVPSDLSIVVLGRHVRSDDSDIAFSTYEVPREQMARLATRALVARLQGDTMPIQTLLPCPIIDGETLVAPKSKEDLT